MKYLELKIFLELCVCISVKALGGCRPGKKYDYLKKYFTFSETK